MSKETRLERWQRTGALQLATAAIVFATWVYFQTQYTAAERPVILNEVLLIVLGWVGLKFAMNKSEDKEKKEPDTDSSSPEPEPESRGRHAR
ncbi:hypothetical protein HWB99_gp044 [Mycobacterium phage DrLupo]|uniref:Holin n=1 Tax=Mycobacterium phage DrLupo TaxID=2499037 RepID=A0A3S9UQL4_9CAUD|nr:hypothetical protein HWB99_gp044 [Mycobacterium phage DrLupo]AZS12580.1 hypothetical protein SEA_DRLUPO_44 [Mycobacterium phage DrLupo]